MLFTLHSFHLDHAAALTYITEKVRLYLFNSLLLSEITRLDEFQRRERQSVYDSPHQGSPQVHDARLRPHEVREAIFIILLTLNLDLISSSSSDALFSPLDMSMSLASIIPVSAHQLITICPGVSFTPYHAGHVLGACMFFIDIAGLKILYTGDYSREEDRHLVKAELPPIRPDVLIVESTYGVQSLEGRDEKELRFTNLVHSIIRRGGHVLLPTFALGRAQELLLILDEYWKRHPDLHSVPIYYASSLARKCMAVYQTYIHTMNSNIRSRFAKRDNPFVFK